MFSQMFIPSWVRRPESGLKRLQALGMAALLPGIASGQQPAKADTFLTDPAAAHLYLNVEAPAGQTYLKSSGHCGVSTAQLTSGHQRLRPEVSHRTDTYGNQFRNLLLRPHPPRPHPGEADFASEVARVAPGPHQHMPLMAVYHADPAVPTDLYFNLGHGLCRMDLSGMTLSNVSVNSAFADLVISYNAQNQTPMKELDIHAAKANIILKYPEYSRAGLITVQNDMGTTQVLLGGVYASHPTLHLQSGVGDCDLMISRSRPVRLILKTGFFSSVDLPDSYRQIEPGVYVNPAYQQQQQGTKIICDVDFGKIVVMESD